jgi:hypothetical protein
VSNGCFHCGALIGEFYEHDAWDEQETVLAFCIQVAEQWKKAIENHCGYEETWIVCRSPAVRSEFHRRRSGLSGAAGSPPRR